MNLGESVENSIKRTSEYLGSLGMGIAPSASTPTMDRFMPSSTRIAKGSQPLFDMGNTQSSSANTGTSAGTSSWGESITTMTWKGWALVIFVLAILGINVFAILGRGTAEITDIFGPIIKKIMALFVGTTGQIVGTTAAGAKAIVNETADVTDRALTKVQDIATPNIPPNPEKRAPSNPPPMPHGGGDMPPTHGAHGPGFCYVGTDDPFRSCVKVGYDDLCMSGEIFPTHELCVNPNLRA